MAQVIKYKGHLYKKVDSLFKVAKSVVTARLKHLGATQVSIDKKDGQAHFKTNYEANTAYEDLKDLLETSAVSVSGIHVTFDISNIDLTR